MKLYVPWILSIALLLVLAGSAFAGQSGPYNAINWGYNDKSGWWSHEDGIQWAKVSAKSCRNEINDGTSDWIQVKLLRDAGIFPDENLGIKDLGNCFGSSFVGKTWNDGPGVNLDGPESFRFELWAYKGGSTGGNVMDFTYKSTWGF